MAKPTGGKAASTAMLADERISTAIETEILLDRSVDGNDLDVKTALGVVTLSGKVDNLLAKQRAVRIAEATKGVRAVVNKIEVLPGWDRTDFDIETDAEAALLFDRATEAWEIGVDVDNGTAELTGSVDSWQEKELAAQVVAGVRGVREIKNDIVVNVKLDRPASEIAADVREALKWDVRVDHGLIDVAVDEDTVRLSGTVGSLAELHQARQDAFVVGVGSVDTTKLKIQDWAKDPHMRETTVVIKSDAELVKAIEDAMLFDPRVNSIDVDANSRTGVVTLHGTVPTVAAKRAAEQDARNTVGVLRVNSLIKVRPEGLSDQTLERRIASAFLRDPYVERYEIGVDVNGGIATLTGTVDSTFERNRADDLAARIYGVSEVKNNLAVDDSRYPVAIDPFLWDYDTVIYGWYDFVPAKSWKSDQAIREDIKEQLWWSPLVSSAEVKVEVDDGVATLYGIVDSQFERQMATEEAYDGGAIWVNNKLTVDN